jgi:hypothetical protein
VLKWITTIVSTAMTTAITTNHTRTVLLLNMTVAV